LEDLLYNIPIVQNQAVYDMPQNKNWSIKLQSGAKIENNYPVRRIYVHDTLVSEYKIGDLESERLAIVYMYLNGVANQQGLAKIWGLHYNSISNYVRAYKMYGMKGLQDFYYQLFLDNTKDAIDTKDNIIAEKNSEQLNLFIGIDDLKEDDKIELSGIETTDVNDLEPDLEEEEVTLDVVKSSVGGSFIYYPFVQQIYGSILSEADKFKIETEEHPQKKYTLSKIILTLIFYILTQVFNPEISKGIRRKMYGILIGANSSPCCRTFREGINLLSDIDFSNYMIKETTKNNIKLGYVQMGILYIDGHFVPYYAKKIVHKGYSTQRRLAMPGHYQNWVNDINGRPVFFYVNNSFIKFTDAIKASVIDALKLMEELGIQERLIIVFDRGGYDSKLFKELDNMKVGFITWKKFNKKFDANLLTEPLSYVNRAGKEVNYLSYKTEIEITDYRKDVEAIAVYDGETGIQATFINNLEHVGILDKTDNYKIKTLDGRWSIENFFKESMVKEDINHQFGYDFEENPEEGEDITYIVTDPRYIELDKKIDKLEQLNVKYNNKKKALIINFQKSKKDLKDFYKNPKVKAVLNKSEATRAELKKSKEEISLLKYKLNYRELHKDQPRKDILNTVKSSTILSIKASIFNMRKRLQDMASECFKDKRELSKFIMALTTSPAEITITNKAYYVKLEKLETPQYQKSAELLIEKLNMLQSTIMDVSGRKLIFQF
jgi:hypothetical protein